MLRAAARFRGLIVAGMCLSVTVLPRTLPGQEAFPQSLEAFRAQLSTINDSTELQRLEHRYHDAQDDSAAQADRRLRLGLVRIRLGELGNGWSFRRATGDFDRATELVPASGSAWTLRGVAYREEGDWLTADHMNIGTRVGFGSYQEALSSFARAVELDPHDGMAARSLYEMARIIGDTTRFEEIVLPALRQAARAGGADTSLLMALGRTERLLGDPAQAVGAFERYLTAGGTRGTGLRELAWSQFVAGEAGDSAYFAGAAEDDSASVAGNREDLALIADSGTLRAFDQVRGPERASFLHRFWSDRAAQTLRGESERLGEHYRRITTAERRYGLEVNRRYYNFENHTDIYRSGSTRFDDRGIVYIRHGEPDARAASFAVGISPNETWRYHRADGDFLLDFAANSGGDIRDYRLIPSVMSIEVHADNHEPADFFRFNDRCPLYPPFCKVLSWGPYGQTRVLLGEQAIATASAAMAVSTDGYELRFAHPLEAAAAAFAVGRAENQQLVHIAYQVALKSPEHLPERVVFRLRLRVRVDLFDDTGHSGGYADTTTLVLMPGTEARRHAVDAVGQVTLRAPSGRWRYRIALASDDSTGIVLPTDSLVVGRFDGSTLAVSDLVLSKERRGALWVPVEGDTAWFNPRRTWARTDTIALYHEIYGLRADSPYSASLSLRRGRKVALTFGWQGLASGEVTRVTRSLSFENVPRGDYELIVEVTSEDGAKARSVRAVRIAD